jgi:hypothetical protein
MAQLHGPRRNSAMEPVSEPAVAEMGRPVPARAALSCVPSMNDSLEVEVLYPA